MNFFAFFFLSAAISVLWIPKIRLYWIYPFIISLVLALFSNLVNLFSILFLIALWTSIALYRERKKQILNVLIFIISFGIMSHILPGFYHIKILTEKVVKSGCIPYTYYLNFDKGSVGLLLLSTLPLSLRKTDWKYVFRSFLIFFPLAALVLLGCALLMDYIHLDMQCPPYTLLWTYHSLFLVAIAEESFFRGFLQRNLTHFFSFRGGSILALLITAFLFGISHYHGGVSFVILSSIAGLFYGGAYRYGGKIEAAILTHFMVNFIHFLGFSYPALQ